MSEIFKTTLTPGKLELVAGWLPQQSWHVGGSGGPTLSKAGGFRLDDPAGQVGIEFMVVADTSDGNVTYYQVVASYRGAPLEGAEHALLGTTEHGVLGTRWVYDGVDDPVVLAQVLALMQGEAVPQAQSESHTTDPTVIARWNYPRRLQLAGREPSTSGDLESTVVLRTTDLGDSSEDAVTLSIVRVLRSEDETAGDQPPAGLGYVSAVWIAADGTPLRGTFAQLTGTD